VCKRERMQLQEDKCRPGRMQLKAEASAVLGVHPPFFRPLSEPCGIERLISAYPHAALKPENHDVFL
jgi:hypothetical protein